MVVGSDRENKRFRGMCLQLGGKRSAKARMPFAAGAAAKVQRLGAGGRFFRCVGIVPMEVHGRDARATSVHFPKHHRASSHLLLWIRSDGSPRQWLVPGAGSWYSRRKSVEGALFMGQGARKKGD